jgi:hypothetical protein
MLRTTNDEEQIARYIFRKDELDQALKISVVCEQYM